MILDHQGLSFFSNFKCSDYNAFKEAALYLKSDLHLHLDADDDIPIAGLLHLNLNLHSDHVQAGV